MEYPDGFAELVKMASKSPLKQAKSKEIWEKFCDSALIGKDRGAPQIEFLKNFLKEQLDYDFVKKSNEFSWHEHAQEFLKERIEKIRDEESRQIISGVLRDLTYIVSTIKQGADFFEKRNLLKDPKAIDGKEQEIINAIVKEREITGMGFVKTILWLQNCGFAKDMAPPTKHLKAFLNNDVGPYYQYYEDDDYFMKRAQEMAKDFRKASLSDIYRAVFFFRIFKSAMPRGSKFTPKKLLSFLKKKKISLDKLQEMLKDRDKMDQLMEELMGR
jgi:hypothetical protein